MPTLPVLSALLTLAACGAPAEEKALDPVCTDPEPPACIDAMIQDLSLHDDKVSDAEVSTTRDGDDFVTFVDASAGGYSRASAHPWTYVRFTELGAERVNVDDETALTDMTWHMAFRRFIIRLNSGDSGPSCVGASALMGRRYDAVDAVPEGVTFLEDDSYTDDCSLINDSSGLPGSPQVAMGPWWDYPGCVDTTGTPFVVQLEDGRVLKLVVERYYDGDGDDECDDSQATQEDGGFLTLRWRAL
ncbi:MAG: hypothetical protein RLZZ299_443 [Pseudomonadota bacterium]|jgi:hypothetical protein